MQLKNDANIETFTMKNITKIYKYKRKKNWTALLRRKTEQKWTLVNLNTKKTEQHFYNGTQNRHEHY